MAIPLVNELDPDGRQGSKAGGRHSRAPSVRDVVILGSTGSIGKQALDVVAAHPERFRVVGLASSGNDVATLARQAAEHEVDVVAVAQKSAASELMAALQHARRIPTVTAGPAAVIELASYPCDVVLNGITGSVGLAPTLAAVEAGRTLALANKESLVAGGALIRKHRRQIVPVDSEHSALAQALRAGAAREVRRLILTASGGPFRTKTAAELADVTPADALAHPTWRMGPVVTINSATLMNKGLEVIETHELFGAEYDVSYDDITVVVHPQSVVHSMVEFCDGSTVAQASTPDMRLPIGLALAWPDRLPSPAADQLAVLWENSHTWQFFPLDDKAFPAAALAREVGAAGGCLPAVFNAANEECVTAFLAGRLRFVEIVPTVRRVVEAAAGADADGSAGLPGDLLAEPGSVEDVLAAEQWARSTAIAAMRNVPGSGSYGGSQR